MFDISKSIRFVLTFGILFMASLCSMWAEGAPHYKPVEPEKYGQNATMICKIIKAGKEMRNVEISAWTKGSNPECRGASQMFFMDCIQLMIYGDRKVAMEWRIWDYDTQTEIVIDDGYIYKVNQESGTNDEPYLIILKNDLLGDVNGDGMVTIADVVMLIDYLQGKVHPDFDISVADANEDNVIDMKDVAAIGNICLNQ